jgi:hypothetical protein
MNRWTFILLLAIATVFYCLVRCSAYRDDRRLAELRGASAKTAGFIQPDTASDLRFGHSGNILNP